MRKSAAVPSLTVGVLLVGLAGCWGKLNVLPTSREIAQTGGLESAAPSVDLSSEFAAFGHAWLKKMEVGDFGSAYHDLSPELKALITKEEFVLRASYEFDLSKRRLERISIEVMGTKSKTEKGGGGGTPHGVLLANLVTTHSHTNKDGRHFVTREPVTVLVEKMAKQNWSVGQYTNLPVADMLALWTLQALHEARVAKETAAKAEK